MKRVHGANSILSNRSHWPVTDVLIAVYGGATVVARCDGAIAPLQVREPFGLHANWLTNRKPMPSGPALLWGYEIDWLHHANSELPFERRQELWKPVALPVHSLG